MVSDNEKTIVCPLFKGKKITVTECFLTAMVCEGISPKSDAEPEIFEFEDYREICLKCPTHHA